MLCAVFLGPREGAGFAAPVLVAVESRVEAEAEADVWAWVVWRRCGGGGEHEDRGEEGDEDECDASSHASEDLRFRLLVVRAGYRRSLGDVGSGGVGRPEVRDCLVGMAIMGCGAPRGDIVVLRLNCGVLLLLLLLVVVVVFWKIGLVSLTPSRPNTTSLHAPAPTSIESMTGLMIGMDARSGESRSSDLRKKSDSGDCSILSQAAQSSAPEPEKEKPVKFGEIGEPEMGEGAESVVRSAALQSSIEL